MSGVPPIGVVVHARFGREPILNMLATAQGVEITDAHEVDRLVETLSSASVVAMTNPSPAEGARIAAALRAPGNSVCWIQALSAGFDGLLQHQLPADVMVTSQGGAMAPPVAEHAVGMLLGMARGLFEIAIRSRSHCWDRKFDPPIASLEGKTAVIVGFGAIGREVARRLRAFDMRVIAVSRTQPAEGLIADFVPLDELHSVLPRADAILLTIALADETFEMFDASAFEACKQGAFLVNVARGELIDQAALKEALESGKLGGAAIDVSTPEPLPDADPLWSAPRLVVSPHTAGAGSPQAGQRIAALFAENFRRFREGDELLHRLR